MRGPFGGHLPGRGAEGPGEGFEREVAAAFGLFVVLLGHRTRGEENFTSASDVVSALAAIRDGGFLLPSGARRFALGALGRQRPRSKLPVVAPPGACFLRKTGELEGVESDAGVFLLPGRALALAVMARGSLWRRERRVSWAVALR